MSTVELIGTPITLWCVARGSTTAFKVIAGTDNDLSDLREMIKEKRKPRFDDFAPDDLILWHVNVDQNVINTINNMLNDDNKLSISGNTVGVTFHDLEGKNIRVVVGVPISELLSLNDYLSCITPRVEYSPYASTSGSSTNAFGDRPSTVTTWKDFFINVNGHSFDDQERKYEKPIFIDDFKPTNEEVVRQAINVNIFMLLNRVNSGYVFSMRTVQGPGNPDYVCHIIDGKLILVIEIKKAFVLRKIKPNQSFPEFYKEDANGKKVIQQLYNYMSTNELKYGVLSTYDLHWFVRRDHKDLLISDPLRYDSTSPTVLKSYAFLAQLAMVDDYSPAREIIKPDDDSPYNLRKRRHDDSNSDQPPSGPSSSNSYKRSFNTSGSQQSSSNASGSRSQSPRRKQKKQKKQKKRNMEAQSFKHGDFKYKSILSAGENNKKVLECEFQEKIIVLKCTDLSKKPNCQDELLNEVEIYKYIAKLQGIYIPELLFYGDLANGMFFVMGMSMVGTDLSHHHKIDKRQKKRALIALKKLHDFKVLHNDIREQNILVDEKGYVYLTDFGFSIRTNDENLFRQEEAQLDRLLEQYCM